MDARDERFVDRMGLLFEADGASRTAGRLLGLLMLCPEPHSLDELTERLQVSKASVSTNARALERYGSIERVIRPGDRRDYYQVAEGMPLQIVARRIEHLSRIRELLIGMAAGEEVPRHVQRRLSQFGSFFEAMIGGMVDARERWLAEEQGDGDAAPASTLRALR